MKTIIKSFALALSLGLVTSVASFADGKPERPTAAASYKSGIYTTMEGKLSIALDKEVGGTVDVLLKNPDGSVVYSKHLGKNESKYRTRLNLSELPDGVYQVEITNGVETTTQHIKLSTQKPTAPSRVVAIN